jgi:hypothetical protein
MKLPPAVTQSSFNLLATRPWSWFLLIAVVAALLGSGCNSHAAPSPQIALMHEITPWPVRVGPARITLSLKDAASQPVTGAGIALEANMAHPGMSPALSEAKEIAPGRYQAKTELAMGGDWVILVHIALTNGQKLERQIELKGVKAK